MNRGDRIRNAYRKSFGGESGKTVLAHLYENLFGKQSTFPTSGNGFELARNEGMRLAWLIIMEQLREEDMDIRKIYEAKLTESRKEAMDQ